MTDAVDWPTALVGLLAVVAIVAGYVLIRRTGQPLPFAGIVPLLAAATGIVAVATNRPDFFVSYTVPLLALWVLWLLLPRIVGKHWREGGVSVLIVGAPLLAIAANAAFPLWPEELWGPATVTAMWAGALAAGLLQALRGSR